MALTADVKIQRFGTPDNTIDVPLDNMPLGNNVKVFGGEIALTDNKGFIKSAATPATTDTCWGVISRLTDNTGGASSAQVVNIERGVFFFQSSTGADLIQQSNVGQDCYVYDQTHVALGSTGRPKAGTIFYIDANLGVAVKMATV